MAITKIHAIKRTVDKSIAYICNPFKTNESSLLSFYNCSQNTAAIDFNWSIKQSKIKDKNQAFHLIQSFAPGEVSEEEAHQIGEELAKAVLGNKYSYVIATHHDKNHVHNHIIFCAVDNIDHKKYHDCKESYRYIKRCNDKILKEHNLSVIKEDPNRLKKSHSYAEWKHTKDGTSWKANLKKDIRECLEFCSSYDEFLKRMNERGYEIKNENPSDGKYISFKAPGQERWIRGRSTTLGNEFTREAIIEKINNYAHDKSTKTAVKIERMIAEKNDGKILDYIDTSDPKFQERAFLKVWANRENFKRLAHNYTLLHREGYQNTTELSDKMTTLQKQSDDERYKAVSIDHEIAALSSSIKNMEQYIKLKPYNDKYRSARNPEAVFQKYEYELMLFFGARKSLKDDGIVLRNVKPEALEKAKDKYHELLREKNSHLDKVTEIDKQLKEMQKLNDEIQKNFELNEEHDRDEKQKKKEQHL